MAAAQNYFERMMQQAPLGRGGDSATPGAGSSGAAGGAPRQPQDPWAARGKAHKLSDS